MNIQLTKKAVEKVLQFMEAQSESQHLRLSVSGQTAKEYLYQFLLDQEVKESDILVPQESFSVLIQKDDQEKLHGATIDWIESVSGSGFHVENPNKPTNNLDSPIAIKVQEILDQDINPGVASHGGHIELLDVIDGRAYVKMSGGCQGCGSAQATLKGGVEQRIKQLVPEIQEVVDTTDHASGSNPYYSS
ncbi:MAG: iron-sulfur cluster assembly accessory protein [Bdellovibrionales bacterium]|nr:iron-sulfur cluster assembly accessory protein [Bdellovibrionales bacterium]